MKIKFTTIREAESLAKKKIRKGTFNWLASGAEDDTTTKLNSTYLDKIKIYPKVFAKNFNFSLKTKFLNCEISSPVLLSPMGHQAQFHKFGELEMAKGVNFANSVSFFSTQSRYAFNEIRKKNPNAKMIWQIFLFGNKDWILNEIKRAENYGSEAIALCLDAPVRSHRFKDRESRYDARKYGKMRKLSQNPSFALRYDWNIIKWIKSKTKKPLILKGILNVQDAYKAKKHNIDILWISNHGGRMFNSGISSGEALKNIREKIGKKATIIVDGGVTKGSDVIKYLCLGANFVGIGKPAIYGLILNGHKGVKQIFDILKSELETASLNGGFKNLKDFNLKRIALKK
ncbi:MAG: hypothetical protein CMG74_04710 [Candidatus Marinimicrobia bacterium]|nr:hypothetical protein [Candidatus Neomarinimicrobiota bacterium]|tara:strand:+ start:4819 stop:5850 length:1032 start_codon:yes stop_codon:yes gene_type:complete